MLVFVQFHIQQHISAKHVWYTYKQINSYDIFEDDSNNKKKLSLDISMFMCAKYATKEFYLL